VTENLAPIFFYELHILNIPIGFEKNTIIVLIHFLDHFVVFLFHSKGSIAKCNCILYLFSVLRENEAHFS
jgi:hypothetical protein